jgi:hypothetical protein
MANIIIKNLNGMMFETDESNFRNYEPYGSTLATQKEWEEYCNPNVVATVEANETPVKIEEAPKTDEVVPTPEVKFAPDPQVEPISEVKAEIKFAPEPEPVLETKSETKTDEVTAETETDAPAPKEETAETEPEPVTEEAPKEKPLSKMVRAELVAKLLEVNPHFVAIEDATNDEIRTEIKQALIDQA